MYIQKEHRLRVKSAAFLAAEAAFAAPSQASSVAGSSRPAPVVKFVTRRLKRTQPLDAVESSDTLRPASQPALADAGSDAGVERLSVGVADGMCEPQKSPRVFVVRAHSTAIESLRKSSEQLPGSFVGLRSVSFPETSDLSNKGGQSESMAPPPRVKRKRIVPAPVLVIYKAPSGLVVPTQVESIEDTTPGPREQGRVPVTANAGFVPERNAAKLAAAIARVDVIFEDIRVAAAFDLKPKPSRQWSALSKEVKEISRQISLALAAHRSKASLKTKRSL